MTEIQASTGAVVNTIPVGTDPYRVSSDGTHVWVTNDADNTVSEIAPNLNPPSITGIAPSSGPGAGGTKVVLTGTNLKGSSAVYFGTTQPRATASTRRGPQSPRTPHRAPRARLVSV